MSSSVYRTNINLSIRLTSAPTQAATGNVSIQLEKIFFALPHLTALTLSAIPTPIILDETTCPVLIGMPVKEHVRATAAVETCAVKD